MKNIRRYTGLIVILSAFMLTGCYTQLQTAHEHQINSESDMRSGYYSSQSDEEKVSREEREAPRAQIPEEEEETYLYGYEDGVEEGYEEGWTDAEEYYFKDYETAQWYRNQGVTLSGSHRVIHHYYHHRPYYPGYGFYHYPSRWSLSFHFGSGYSRGYYNPWFYHDFYAWHSDPFYRWGYYRYPAYGPYFGSPYYGGNLYVFYNNFHRTGRAAPSRSYGPRSTGLRNEGVTRSQGGVRTDAVRSDSANRNRSSSLERRRNEIRSEVGRSGRSSSVNRNSGSESGTNRVNRTRTTRTGNSNVNRERGSVDRSRSSGSSSTRQRSSGSNSSTDRQRSSNERSESMNRSQSVDIRSAGDTRRSESDNRVIRSRTGYSSYSKSGSRSVNQSIQDRIQSRTSDNKSAIKVSPPALKNNNSGNSRRTLGDILFNKNNSSNSRSSSSYGTSRRKSSSSSSVRNSSGRSSSGSR
ncbi:MAG: hypothetical protein WD599_02015, partial [Balneolaceae bacterium]